MIKRNVTVTATPNGGDNVIYEVGSVEDAIKHKEMLVGKVGDAEVFMPYGSLITAEVESETEEVDDPEDDACVTSGGGNVCFYEDDLGEWRPLHNTLDVYADQPDNPRIIMADNCSDPDEKYAVSASGYDQSVLRTEPDGDTLKVYAQPTEEDVDTSITFNANGESQIVSVHVWATTPG